MTTQQQLEAAEYMVVVFYQQREIIADTSGCTAKVQAAIDCASLHVRQLKLELAAINN